MISTILASAVDAPTLPRTRSAEARRIPDLGGNHPLSDLSTYLVKGPVGIRISRGASTEVHTRHELTTTSPVGKPDNWLSIDFGLVLLSELDPVQPSPEGPCQVVHMSVKAGLGTVPNRMSTAPESQRDARWRRSCSMRSTSAWSFWSALAFSSIVRTACMTVVWSRPPK